MVGRTESVLNEVADKLDIPYRGHWIGSRPSRTASLISLQSERRAAPTSNRSLRLSSMAVMCFATSRSPERGDSAKSLHAGCGKGSKTAYAASFRYMPQSCMQGSSLRTAPSASLWSASASRTSTSSATFPFGWSHTKEAGGGRLNNNFTHLLSIAATIGSATKILAIKRRGQDDLGKAPIVEGVHNFKTRRELIPKDIDDPNLEWGEVRRGVVVHGPGAAARAGTLRNSRCRSCSGTAGCGPDSTRTTSYFTAAKAPSTSRGTTAAARSTSMQREQAGRKLHCPTRLPHGARYRATTRSATGLISFASSVKDIKAFCSTRIRPSKKAAVPADHRPDSEE